MYSLSQIVRALEVPHPPNMKPPSALVSPDTQPIEKARRTWGALIPCSEQCSKTLMSSLKDGLHLRAYGLQSHLTCLASNL
jgi:hypothetical protein